MVGLGVLVGKSPFMEYFNFRRESAVALDWPWPTGDDEFLPCQETTSLGWYVRRI